MAILIYPGPWFLFGQVERALDALRNIADKDTFFGIV